MTRGDIAGSGDDLELAELRGSVTKLETGLARMGDEVRTRRIVVVDQRERERMVAEVVGDVLEVRVDLPPGRAGERTALLCFSTPAEEEFGGGLGAQLWVDGDLVGEVGWWSDGSRQGP